MFALFPSILFTIFIILSSLCPFFAATAVAAATTATKGGAIAQLVRPVTVTPEVPGSILGKTLRIFQRHFQCFPLT